jgi:hypothetical protein
MYGLSRMALDNIVIEEAISLNEACLMYATLAEVAAADGNDALGKAVADAARLRIICYLTFFDEVALPWKITVDPEKLQQQYDQAERTFGRWWTQADKHRFAFLLHEVMTKAMELNDEKEGM